MLLSKTPPPTRTCTAAVSQLLAVKPRGKKTLTKLLQEWIETLLTTKKKRIRKNLTGSSDFIHKDSNVNLIFEFLLGMGLK